MRDKDNILDSACLREGNEDHVKATKTMPLKEYEAASGPADKHDNMVIHTRVTEHPFCFEVHIEHTPMTDRKMSKAEHDAIEEASQRMMGFRNDLIIREFINSAPDLSAQTTTSPRAHLDHMRKGRNKYGRTKQNHRIK